MEADSGHRWSADTSSIRQQDCWSCKDL